MKRKLYQRGQESMADHRADFESCPHCDHKMRSNMDWVKVAHTLCLRPRFYRAGFASILSECPKCFCTSWVHLKLDSVACYDTLPKSWKVAAKKESAAQKLVALRQWGKGL